MPEYTVFSRGIYSGTIAALPYAARLAWGVVLFEAEKLRGKVRLPVYDLAQWAHITIEEAQDALARFQEEDPLSGSEEEGGRRLVPIEGEKNWYQVVTWEKHVRERQRYFATLRKQRQRARDKD